MGNPKPSTILHRAAQHLSERGLAKGTVINSWTGEVDVVGALQLAAGIQPTQLAEDVGEAVIHLVPQASLFGFLAAYEAVDGETEDIYEWQDAESTTTETAVQLLTQLAGKYSRSPILDGHPYA